MTSTWVLLRGLTRECRHWGEFPAVLRGALPDASVVMPDLPGNGRLNRVSSPLNVDAMAERCRADLLALGVARPYYLLALSMGAMVALAWARRYPEELLGCVLVNSSLRSLSPFHHRLKVRNYPTLLKLALSRSDVAREQFILDMTSRRHDKDAQLLAQWAAFRRDRPVSPANAVRQLVAAMRCSVPASPPAAPLLVLASCGDGLVDSRCSQSIARYWGARLSMHPDAGHDLPLDDPGWVASEVKNWLEAM